MTILTMKWLTLFSKYISDVGKGKVKLSKYARLAIERYNKDVADKKWTFDTDKADHAIRFIEMMPHIEGSLEGQRLRLEPWQIFIVANLFGWVDDQRLRRFHEAYIEVSRKNGKSTLMAAIGNYMAIADGEMGAQVFSGATSLDQARKVFDPAWMMLQKMPEFRKKAKIRLLGTAERPVSIHRQGLRSFFKPMVGKPGDGDNPHCAIIDEFHEHPTEVMYKAMKTGMRARLQPMVISITTAGMNLSYPCYKKHKQMKLLLGGTYSDDRTFSMIFSIDEDDEPLSLAAAIKANPNYGVSLTATGIEAAINDAKNGSGIDLNYHLTKHLGVWVSGSNAFFNVENWRKNTIPEADIINKLHELDVYVGIDTASSDDITAVHFIAYEPVELCYYTFGRYFIADAHMNNLHDSVKDMYKDFLKNKEFELVNDADGLTDFAKVAQITADLSINFNIKGFVRDKTQWGVAGPAFYKHFDENLFIPAKYGSHQSQPLDEMKAKSTVAKFKHNGSSVLEWMVGNAEVKVFDNSKRLAKNNEKDHHAKVDGVEAIVYGMQRLLEANQENNETIINDIWFL